MAQWVEVPVQAWWPEFSLQGRREPIPQLSSDRYMLFGGFGMCVPALPHPRPSQTKHHSEEKLLKVQLWKFIYCRYPESPFFEHFNCQPCHLIPVFYRIEFWALAACEKLRLECCLSTNKEIVKCCICPWYNGSECLLWPGVRFNYCIVKGLWIISN